MKKIKLSVRAQKGRIRDEYYERDIEGSISGFLPGEWSLIEHGKEEYICFVNPHVSQGPVVRVIAPKKQMGEKSPEEILTVLINRALDKRHGLRHLNEGSRLIYGQADCLPGLVVDQYQNCALLQVNTAGLDKYRDFIKDQLNDRLKMDCFFLDKKSYRDMEGLPQYELESFPDIEVSENGIQYYIPKDVLQKVGHYYDHRENRRKLNWWINQWDREIELACDLFCYCGSWGLNALKGNEDKIEKMIFVDQANMQESIAKNLELNSFEGKGEFVRDDCLKWLDEQKPNSFDLIISDPPAFSKSLKNKAKAIGGYEKLFNKIIPLIKNDGLLVAASCTHGVSLAELDRTVNSCANKVQSLQLIDIGVQGADHPFASLSSSENYIKFLLYRVFK